MDELLREKEIIKLEKDLIKDGRKEFVLEVRQGDSFTRDQKLLKLAKHRSEIKSTKANDEELRKARLNKNSLEAPYREQLKWNDKLTRFVTLVMEEEGDQ